MLLFVTSEREETKARVLSIRFFLSVWTDAHKNTALPTRMRTPKAMTSLAVRDSD
jgi:hypothetical protein